MISLGLLLGTTDVSAATTFQECSNQNNMFGVNHPDYISHIPGYNQPLPSSWYSGYLTYEFMNRTIHTHYTFVEAEDNDDGTKPIIYWSSKFLPFFFFFEVLVCFFVHCVQYRILHTAR